MENLLFSLEEFEKSKYYWLTKFSDGFEESKFRPDYSNNLEYIKQEFQIIFEQELSELVLSTSKNNDMLLYIVLFSGLLVLVNKYTNSEDITIGSPVLINTDYSDSNSEMYSINNFIGLREQMFGDMTFKELLMRVKQTVVDGYENQHYPLNELCKALKINSENISFLRIILMLKNVHGESLLKELKDISNDITFFISQENNKLQGKIVYNSSLFSADSIMIIAQCYMNILSQVLRNKNTKMNQVELISENDKVNFLNEVDNQVSSYEWRKCIHELFEEQAVKNKEKISVSSFLNYEVPLHQLKLGTANLKTFKKIEKCRFKLNQYICKVNPTLLNDSNIDTDEFDKSELLLLKTNMLNYVVINKNVINLLKQFDGLSTISEIYSNVKDNHEKYFIVNATYNEHSWNLACEKTIIALDKLEISFTVLLSNLYKSNLVQLQDINIVEDNFNEEFEKIFECKVEKCFKENETTKIQSGKTVLLLGETPGMPTVGLLQIASFLRRNGYETFCQFNDLSVTSQSLRNDIEKTLFEIKPQIVGVSIKWFPHIKRAVEICKIIKEYSRDIEVVIGGNTASIFSDDFIKFDFVDYIILGDGEIPFLKICQGTDEIPNCNYKKNGKIIKKQISYIQNEENSKDVYLSNLDEIFIKREHLFSIPYIYIYTGKGCSMNCFYCGGCQDAQIKEFNRKKPFIRGIQEVRKDIVAAKTYSPTLMFVDSFSFNTMEYHRNLWDNIDLSNHFCSFYFYKIPEPEFVQLISKTFKYAYFNFDLCTLSERHRKELFALKMIKPLPTDEQLLQCMFECEKYNNIEVKISLISGLPLFIEEDMQSSMNFLKALQKYSIFMGLEWGRLHAQPGASIVATCEEYNMYSQATTFEEFLTYSKLNFQMEPSYPDIYNFEFPYIYFKDDKSNSESSKHFGKVNYELTKIKNDRRNIGVFENISFDLLNKRSNQLARYLRNIGIGHGDVVAILLDQSIEAAVGILGALKSGATYLPIDVEDPKDRISYIVEDSDAKILITQEDLLNMVEFKHVLNINDENILKMETANLETISKPSSLANIIYTSGSTGTPKGVMIEHQSLVNYALWRIKNYSFNSDDRTLQLVSLGFDGFGASFYASILSGGNLVVLSSDCRKDVTWIRKIIRNKKITNTSVIPSFFEAIIEGSTSEDLETMKFVVLAAEKMNPKLIGMTKAINSDIILINEYGPTECTIATSAYYGVKESKYSNVGKVVTNNQIYILNNSNNLMPIGVIGEICVAGVGIARGYLKNNFLTDQKFVPNPFKENSLMYRTGDIGRLLQDGTIEYVGRVDEQVKIRGLRVELGEIERCLLKNEFIVQAVVMDFEDSNCKYLCAYFVSERTLDTSIVKLELEKHLPRNMVPSFFVQVEQIPRTLRGKVDKKLLPNPKQSEGILDMRDISVNQSEQKILEIWSKVLGTIYIGINDNFFDVGGNSILLMKVHNQIEKNFTKHVSITDLFSYPTISKLSNFMQNIEDSNFNRISLCSITFPNEFFSQGSLYQQYTPLKFKLSEFHFSGLKKIAESKSMEISKVLFGLYALLLTQISKSKKIVIYTNIVDESIFPIELDFSTIQDFDKLFVKIDNILKESPKERQLEISDIKYIEPEKEIASISTMFADNNVHFKEMNMFNVFDIRFFTEINEEEISFYCEYNKQKILNEKMQEMIQNYVELIEQYIEKNFE